MQKRGKVLRDTSAGPGLLMVQGQQYPFALEGVWKSEAAPRPGLVVDVEFDQGGQIVAIIAVPESQLAKEQAEAIAIAAREKGKIITSAAVAKFGLPTLIATALLMIAWLFLSAVNIQTFLGKLDLTFWQLLGFLNSGSPFEAMMQGHRGPSAGFYGFFATMALAGPYVPYFWKDKRACLSGALPLLFMLMVWLMLRSSVNSSMGADVSGPLGDMASQAREETMKAISLGLGTYLSGLVGLYFAGMAIKKFLLARAVEPQARPGAKQVAA